MLKKILVALAYILTIVFSFQGIAQVGINTSTPAAGALLDIHSDNKGLLVPRVILTDTEAYAPITPADPKTTGLLIYNTNSNSPEPTDLSRDVTPGFYYWSGSTWRRFFNQGYTLEKQQTDEVRAVTNTKIVLTGLDTDEFTVPFSGTYQIIVNAYFANGANTDTGGGQNYDGASQGAIILQWDPLDDDTFVDLRQSYFTASSKYLDDSDPTDYMNFLAQNVNIIYNIDLQAGTTYQFRVVGEQWATRNSEDGWFGKDTNSTDYPGSSSIDTQKGSMSLTLVRQY